MFVVLLLSLIINDHIKEIEIFNIPYQKNQEKIILDPVMFSDSSNPYDMEFYWGGWNTLGKKEGFGIKIFLNGNFYFGTFKDDLMHGLGLYIFADKGENKENKIISVDKFMDDVYYSKQFFDTEKRRTGKCKNKDFDKNFNKQFKKFIENKNENKLDYFTYFGEFVCNKFEGFGGLNYGNIKFLGKFNNNKNIKD